jgi:hypothetical protein
MLDCQNYCSGGVSPPSPKGRAEREQKKQCKRGEKIAQNPYYNICGCICYANDSAANDVAGGYSTGTFGY